MSRATVRSTVRAWIRGQELAGVSKVFRDAPYWIAGESFPFEVTGSYAAALFVHLDRDAESRITIPAPNPPERTIDSGFVGQKVVTYTATIGILYQYLIPPTSQLSADPIEEDGWVDGFDAIVDALKARLRSDPNLGDPSVIFQAGQSNDDIVTDQDFPTLDGGLVKCFGRIQFRIDEIITA